MSEKAPRICRVCSVENMIARVPGWVAIGNCAICAERHALFDIKEHALEHAELIAESHAQRREDIAAHRDERLAGLRQS